MKLLILLTHLKLHAIHEANRCWGTTLHIHVQDIVQMTQTHVLYYVCQAIKLKRA